MLNTTAADFILFFTYLLYEIKNPMNLQTNKKLLTIPI